jgi:hypothetical protein
VIAFEKWVREEPGWYSLRNRAAVCKEADGLWHCYVTVDDPPGDFAKDTMKEAKEWCERKLAKEDHK